MSRDLVFEIGVEEIPSVPLYDAVAQLKDRAAAALDAARLGYAEIRSMGAPRRLVLVVSGLAERQEDLSLRVKGPAKRAAFDASGAPTKAAEGFARSRGLDVSALTVEEADGGEYVFALVEESGRSATEVLPGLLGQLVTDIDWAKSMRWGSGRDRFIRPVRWLLALFGDDVVPVRYAGLDAGRTTWGHRFLAGPVEVPSADAYASVIEGALVVADHDARASLIRAEVERVAAEMGARAVVPEKTFAEVVNLVEWPTVGVGRFDEEFLAVPREVVEEAMESHQRYFPVEGEDGALLPNFIVVHNGDPARTDAIVAGHERVIRARLADAAFFYTEDLARPLEEHVRALEHIVFHEKLGSLADKARRTEALAVALAEQSDAPEDTRAYAQRAAHLAKADLVTHVVIEFTSLQGVMGYHYALAAGEATDVAEAIVDHYRPRFSGDALPRSHAGSLVSIADKLDTIVGIFALGQAPTGSADPYALRRFAIGILTMIMDGGVRLHLTEAIASALEGYEGVVAGLDKDAVGSAVQAFFDGRLEVMLRDRGFAYDTIEAVMARRSADPADTERRVRALQAFRVTEAGADLAVAFKRAANLANAAAGTSLDEAILGPEERALAEAVGAASSHIATLMGIEHEYDAALASLAELRASVDAFFDGVLVMDEDAALRANRLALLNRLVALFDDFADFGKLAG